jgi:hypothetical protein
MFVIHSALSGGHSSTALCHQGKGLQKKRAIKEDTGKDCEVVFTVEGVPVDSERWFIYLGRLLSTDDDDWLAVLRNVAKTQQRLAYISRILRREGATSKISTMFYKAVIQKILLFGSESWVLAPIMLGKLEGFHQQIARWLTSRAPVYLRSEGTWQYHPLGNAMEEACLYIMNEYITRRRNKMVDYVKTRPLYNMCLEM